VSNNSYSVWTLREALDELAECRKQLAEARAALLDLKMVGERTVYLATDGEWYDKHAAALKAAREASNDVKVNHGQRATSGASQSQR